MPYSLETFFEVSRDLLCIAGYDGYFKKINPALIHLLEYSKEELLSRKISDFIYEEDRLRTASNRKNLKKNLPLLNFENRYISKSGNIIWLDWTAIPLPDENLIYAIAKNITYKKKLESERAVHLLALDKKNKNLKNLNFKTSHDLRSPVNNLLTLCNILDLNKITDPETLQVFNLIKNSTEGLRDSLNSYVDSLTETEELESSRELISLSVILHVVQSSISALIFDSRAKITTDFSAFDVLFFNRDFMESIYLNLITNAIKYAKPDVFPKINIASKIVAGEQILVFSDNGLGFDMKEVAGKIFNLNQRFHSTKDSKGVGLYLVHSHITEMGGKIAVTSAVNEGTTFTITFK
ncbi:PAS domain S-box protein [Cellulophaga sp. E16_2]|uniref:PAS domain-containing sensor histidine kinase n=1 Tax=Cellulophaga sp. E16_2 TaxID=2789297 RepID=UPI001A9316BB|nr:PAS domain-containing sensor histidine kinase [Cellulophaga sp. E16_2]MBO0590375.1 PAS domain S-box protein [Cellulophaga sp. E16_2]